MIAGFGRCPANNLLERLHDLGFPTAGGRVLAMSNATLQLVLVADPVAFVRVFTAVAHYEPSPCSFSKRITEGKAVVSVCGKNRAEVNSSINRLSALSSR